MKKSNALRISKFHKFIFPNNDWILSFLLFFFFQITFTQRLLSRDTNKLNEVGSISSNEDHKLQKISLITAGRVIQSTRLLDWSWAKQ